MHRQLILIAIAVVASAVAPAQWNYVYSAQPNAAIPASGTGGAAGACSTLANKTTSTLVAADSIKLTDVAVMVNLTHSWAHDLRITLYHGSIPVILFDQYATTSGKSFSGHYTFHDSANSTIAAAVNPNLPALVPASYQPQSPLSAFNGLSSAGFWTLEICDLAGGDTGVLFDWSLTTWSAHVFSVNIPQAEAIPDGGPGGCIAPVTHVINVPAGGGPVSDVHLGLHLIHTRAADLAITVTHGPVTVAICNPNTPPSALSLNWWYYFSDSAGSTWDQGLLSGGPFNVPTDEYRPDSPFSAFDGLDSSGPWFITVCDAVGTHTGFLAGIELQYAATGFYFDVLQPQGSSSITLKNTGGTSFNHYLNAFTLTPGTFPAGWLNGLDISMTELVNQINLGAPFFGALDMNGNATTLIPGPIPAGLAIQFASFDITPAGLIVNSIPARSYTTAP